MGGLLDSPHDLTMVSELMLTKDVQAESFVDCGNNDTSTSVCSWKSFRLRGECDKLMDSHL